tara:strand:+ start:1220 stop:2236 length:1017 start_codon:yes stop_codon:yes gene_type:complete
MQILIDREKSLKNSPPSYPDGINQTKRLNINLDRLIEDKQIRVLKLNLDNTEDIRTSLKVNGWLYDKPVPVVVETDKSKYRLLCGYNRVQALKDLDMSSVIVDVVEGSPRRILEYSFISNHIAPETGNTIADLVNGVKIAVNTKVIENTDKDVKAFINVTAADKLPKTKDKIFNDFREDVRKEGDTIKPYNIPMIKKVAEDVLNIQYAGSGNKTIKDHLGYVTHNGLNKTIMLNSIIGLRKSLGKIKKVMIYGYVDKPKAVSLTSDRQDFLETLDKDKKSWIAHYAYMLGKTAKQIEKDLIWPFEFGGFLPQDETPDPKNEGKPKESTLVDVKGDIFK